MNCTYTELDKGKAKIPEHEDNQSDENKLVHPLDIEYDGFDMPIMRTPRVKKVIAIANEKLHGSTHEKNPIS